MANKAVFGTTRTQHEAQELITALMREGFADRDISLLFPHRANAHEDAGTLARDGAVVGGSIGLILGVVALGIPGLGVFLAAGPLLVALGGAATGAVLGKFIGAFEPFGIPEHVARDYARRLAEGYYLVSLHVTTSSDIERAKRLFTAGNAENIAATDDDLHGSSAHARAHP